MSFDFPQQPPRRKKGGISGIAMLLIVGMALFFFMSARSGTGVKTDGDDRPQGQRATERDSNRSVDRGSVNDMLREADEERRLREGVGRSTRSAGSNAMPQGASQKDRDSDWSIEDVDGKSRSTSTGVKKTKGKDGWSLEEVPTGKKSGTGFELNNSSGGNVELKQKSDWSVEDVDVKNKKTTEGDWSVEEVEKGSGGK